MFYGILYVILTYVAIGVCLICLTGIACNYMIVAKSKRYNNNNNTATIKPLASDQSIEQAPTECPI